MIEVIITSRYKGLKPELKSTVIFSGGVGAVIPVPPVNAPPGVVVIPYPEPFVFEFNDTDTPELINFDTLYAPTYGRNPRFTLIFYQASVEGGESENELVQYIPPKITIVDNVITNVKYELGGSVSGKIIINK